MLPVPHRSHDQRRRQQSQRQRHRHGAGQGIAGIEARLGEDELRVHLLGEGADAHHVGHGDLGHRLQRDPQRRRSDRGPAARQRHDPQHTPGRGGQQSVFLQFALDPAEALTNDPDDPRQSGHGVDPDGGPEALRRRSQGNCAAQKSGALAGGVLHDASGNQPPPPSVACHAVVNSGNGTNNVSTVRKRKNRWQGRSLR